MSVLVAQAIRSLELTIEERLPIPVPELKNPEERFLDWKGTERKKHIKHLIWEFDNAVTDGERLKHATYLISLLEKVM